MAGSRHDECHATRCQIFARVIPTLLLFGTGGRSAGGLFSSGGVVYAVAPYGGQCDLFWSLGARVPRGNPGGLSCAVITGLEAPGVRGACGRWNARRSCRNWASVVEAGWSMRSTAFELGHHRFRDGSGPEALGSTCWRALRASRIGAGDAGGPRHRWLIAGVLDRPSAAVRRSRAGTAAAWFRSAGDRLGVGGVVAGTTGLLPSPSDVARRVDADQGTLLDDTGIRDSPQLV